MRAILAVGWIVLVLPGPALAQNFPPVARGSATPAQAWVGQEVEFSAADSIDPDSGPEPLTFEWTFSDGASATGVSAVHAFAEVRAYPVTLTADDGADTGIDQFVVYVLAPPLSEPSAHTSPIALAPDGATLWVANPDADTVSEVAVAGATLALVAERPVCRQPRTLALEPGGARLFVACQGQRALAAIDLATGNVRLIPVGAEPYGVVALGSGILVSNQGDGTLTWVSPDLETTMTWPTGDGPRAIAVTADGSRAYVTSYVTRGAAGRVTIHDLATGDAIAALPLADDPGPDTASSGKGVPNVLSAAAIDPAGRRLWVGGLKSNTTVGQYRTGGVIAPHNFVRGVAVPIDLAAGAEEMIRRIDTNDADSVSAIGFSPDGRYAYFAHQGAGSLSIYDLSKATLFDPGAGASVPFEGRIETGDAPQGIAVSPDGSTLYVSNYLSREVVALDVRDPTAPAIAARLIVTGERLPPAVANGKRLFFRSRAPIHSESGYVACASCHVDGGGSDGRVWDLTQAGEGLRNTTDLRGRAGMGQGMVHWSANFDEIQDFENPIVTMFGGTGLAGDGAPPNPPLGAPNAGRSQDLDDLAAYVTSLAYTPRSPARGAGGALSEAARRGEALFLDPALRCTECHPPPAYTTSSLDGPELLDTGTLGPGSGQRLGGPLDGIDVPTLIGLWDGAPYFHDGSAPTLRDVFRGRPGVLEAELTADLDDGELDDLVAYLLSIDAPAPDPEMPPVPEPEPEGCGCRAAGSRPATGLLLALAAVSLFRRRRRTTLRGMS